MDECHYRRTRQIHRPRWIFETLPRVEFVSDLILLTVRRVLQQANTWNGRATATGAFSIMRSVTPLSAVPNRVPSNTSRVLPVFHQGKLEPLFPYGSRFQQSTIFSLNLSLLIIKRVSRYFDRRVWNRVISSKYVEMEIRVTARLFKGTIEYLQYRFVKFRLVSKIDRWHPDKSNTQDTQCRIVA